VKCPFGYLCHYIDIYCISDIMSDTTTMAENLLLGKGHALQTLSACGVTLVQAGKEHVFV